MEIFGFAIMLLSAVIAWQTWKNGQWIKQMLETIHKEGEQRHQEVMGWLKEANEQERQRHQEVVEYMKKMDERTVKISEQIERVPEKTKELLSG